MMAGQQGEIPEEMAEEISLRDVGKLIRSIGNKINLKVIAVIILIVVIIAANGMIDAYSFISNTKECREIVGSDQVNYENNAGIDECCFNVDDKYACYNIESLKNNELYPYGHRNN